MFDYSSLETLRAVETEGSYGRAARNLGVTRSAITQRINTLEDRWGTSITLRKPVNPTKHGTRLCRHVDQVRLLESKLYLNDGDNFDAYEIEPHAIRLLFDADLLPTGFLSDLQLYVELQNDFEFEVVRTDSSDIQAETRPDRVIAAISSSWVQSAHFEAHHLGTHHFVAVAHPDYAKRNFFSGVDPSSFRKVTSVTYGGTSDCSEQFLGQVFGHPVETRTQQLYSNSGVLKACLNQQGWAILPKLSLSDHIEQGTLVDLFPDTQLSIDLYFFVSRFISEALPEVAATVLEAAKHNLDPET